MSKAEDIAKDSARGTFHLLWGLVISTIISSGGTIFIARLLGSDLYGLYSIILTTPNLLSLFRDWSINQAMIKFSAQFHSENRLDEIRSVFITGIIFEITSGLILTILSLLFSDFLATNIFGRPTIAPLIQIASFSILANGLIAAATSIFTGYEKMELNSVMLISQSIFKTVLIIALVILGLGTAGATIGFTVSTFIACLIGVALVWNIYRHLPKPISEKLEIKAYLTTMLTYSFPLSLAAIIRGLLPQFYAFLLPIYYTVDNTAIGNYNVALNFVVLITFLATPITTMMFPAFSKLDPEKDKVSLKNIFKFSIKYASLFVIPTTAVVMCLAQPAVETLFGRTYNTAPLFLALLAIQYLFTAIGSLSLSNLLNGQGKSMYILKMAALTGFIGFPLGYLSIMNFGVLGLIAATLIANLPSMIIGLRYIEKNYGAKVDYLSSTKILLSSAISAIATYFITMELPLANWIRLLLGGTLFIVILVPAILLSKAIDRIDIDNVRGMTNSLGAAGKILTILLNFIEKLMIIFNL
jgi:O-antigen/teichoic acid export membrane protein